jgi:Mn-dependent DtxR family transcriptional regulator
MAMSENSRKVLDFLKANDGVKLTAADIAEALDLQKRSVDGIVTSALQRKGLAVRTPAEVEVADESGNVTHKPVKFISLTADGLAYDPDATE